MVHVAREGTSSVKKPTLPGPQLPKLLWDLFSLADKTDSDDSQTNTSQSVTGIRSKSKLTLHDTRMFPKTKFPSPTICAEKEPDRHAEGAPGEQM